MFLKKAVTKSDSAVVKMCTAICVEGTFDSPAGKISYYCCNSDYCNSSLSRMKQSSLQKIGLARSFSWHHFYSLTSFN